MALTYTLDRPCQLEKKFVIAELNKKLIIRLVAKIIG